MNVCLANGCIFLQESNASQAAGIPFHVEGMKCLACCARVKQHVLATTGAESCQVDFEGATVTVQGAGVSKETIVSSLATLGYVATPIAKMLGAGEAYQEQKP
jgi:Cd2+/Zn2+-exporting ATPase